LELLPREVIVVGGRRHTAGFWVVETQGGQCRTQPLVLQHTHTHTHTMWSSGCMRLYRVRGSGGQRQHHITPSCWDHLWFEVLVSSSRQTQGGGLGGLLSCLFQDVGVASVRGGGGGGGGRRWCAPPPRRGPPTGGQQEVQAVLVHHTRVSRVQQVQQRADPGLAEAEPGPRGAGPVRRWEAGPVWRWEAGPVRWVVGTGQVEVRPLEGPTQLSPGHPTRTTLRRQCVLFWLIYVYTVYIHVCIYLYILYVCSAG